MNDYEKSLCCGSNPNLLKEILDISGYSLYRVSKETGIKYTTLSSIKNGKTNFDKISLVTYLGLLSYYNIIYERFNNKSQ